MASRDIEPGETILLDEPLAVGPNPGGTLQCITCGFGVFRFICTVDIFCINRILLLFRLNVIANYLYHRGGLHTAVRNVDSHFAHSSAHRLTNTEIYVII